METTMDANGVSVHTGAPRYGTDMETELRLFMRDTSLAVQSFALTLATMTERLTGVRDDQRAMQAELKTLPERISRLEEKMSFWEKNDTRRLAVMAIVMTVLGILVPILLKGLK